MNPTLPAPCRMSIARSVGAPFKFRLIALMVLSVAGCTTVKSPPDALALVISGDTAGWIVPCGCTSNQSGGLARRGTFIETLRKTQTVVLADVGGTAAGTAPYDRTKFEAILMGDLKMGLVAHNIGAAEARLGGEYLRDVSQRLSVPFVSCNVSDSSGRLLVDSHRIINIAGRRIALAGVLSDRESMPQINIQSPRSAVLNLLPKLAGQFDHLIVLAYLPEAELRAFAAALPEADAVIGGPTGQAIAPEQTGPTWLAAATNKGKFVISLAVAKHEKSWRGTVHELTDQIADDLVQTENVTAFHRTLASRDFTATETSFVNRSAASVPPDASLAGSDQCVDCHSTSCATWQTSSHASAWQSLTKTGSQVDAYCQQCHTTGYGWRGGFESVSKSPQRVSVGCEDCHGPGKAHVADPKIRTLFYRQAAYHCDRCHDRENSPKFSYETYWPKIAHQGESP